MFKMILSTEHTLHKQMHIGLDWGESGSLEAKHNALNILAVGVSTIGDIFDPI
jgi:hypothetical protein